jgi:hypothetical protein
MLYEKMLDKNCTVEEVNDERNWTMQIEEPITREVQEQRQNLRRQPAQVPFAASNTRCGAMKQRMTWIYS